MKDLVGDSEKYAARVAAFKQRTFTGGDVLAIADYLGVGVGATLMASDRLDRLREEQPTDADYDDPPRS
jgi:hypothetical protein